MGKRRGDFVSACCSPVSDALLCLLHFYMLHCCLMHYCLTHCCVAARLHCCTAALLHCCA
eukprot:354857-Chlamydomonas_euryale.AAC.12